MKKSLKIVLITLFGLVTILMVVQNIHSKESIPLSSNEQLTINNSEKKPEFLLFRKTLEELSKNWSENRIKPYRKALKKFPDVDSCLITPKNADSINWSLIKTTTELEVCLSRIHSYIRDVDKSEEWFKRQGFKVNVRSYSPGSSREGFYSVTSRWSVPLSGSLKNRKSPMSGIRIYYEEFFASSGVGIGMEISPNYMVTDVSVEYSRK